MTEEQVRALITAVVEEILARQRAKRVLVLWAGALLGCGEAWEAMRRLADLGLDLHYLQTPSAERLLNQAKVTAVGTPAPKGHYVLEHDLLVVPTLTSNLTAKVAHGVADCLGSNVIADFIQTGKPVIASRTAVDPAGAPKQGVYPLMPPGYAALLAGNLATLAGFGVTLADADQLDAAVLAVPGPAAAGVTEGTVPLSRVRLTQQLISFATVAMCPDGTVFSVAPTAIVTAAAADYARFHHQRIVKEA